MTLIQKEWKIPPLDCMLQRKEKRSENRSERKETGDQRLLLLEYPVLW